MDGAAAVAAAPVQAGLGSFLAPSGILAAGGLPEFAAFAALLAWLVACSLTVLARSGPMESPAAEERLE